MDNPFDMSFEQIMAQATANMEADRGGASPSQQPATAPEKAESAQNGSAEKSFLEMVEEAKKGKEFEAQKPPESGIPTGMSFEELEKQAAPAMNPSAKETPVSETPGSELSFEAMMAQAQSTAGLPTFDDMFKQATGNAAQQADASKKEEHVKEKQAEEKPKEEPFNQPVTGAASFDSLLKQAEQMAGVTSKEEPAREEPAREEPVKEEPVKEEPVKEEPVKEEPAKEEPAKEEPAKEENKQKTKKGKKSSDKKEDEPKEALPDITNEYEVDLSGDDKHVGNRQDAEKPAEEISKLVQSEKASLSLDSLFSEDEIDAFRLMIHSFVRREFKRAMVGAVTDLLSEFKDE